MPWTAPELETVYRRCLAAGDQDRDTWTRLQYLRDNPDHRMVSSLRRRCYDVGLLRPWTIPGIHAFLDLVAEGRDALDVAYILNREPEDCRAMWRIWRWMREEVKRCGNS